MGGSWCSGSGRRSGIGGGLGTVASTSSASPPNPPSSVSSRKAGPVCCRRDEAAELRYWRYETLVIDVALNAQKMHTSCAVVYIS
jgi:hypothetical protein